MDKHLLNEISNNILIAQKLRKENISIWESFDDKVDIWMLKH